MKAAYETLHSDWRALWVGVGLDPDRVRRRSPWSLCANRGSQEEMADAENERTDPVERSYSLGEALRPARLLGVALATSFYGLVAAGMSLFNQSLLANAALIARCS